MTEDAVGSALLRRYIGRRFQALRVRAGLTQEQAATALQRSRSTVARLEDGDERIRFRDSDVKAILELYRATDQDAERLLALTAETRNGRRKSWWHDYTETSLPPSLALYVALEDGAETIRRYEPELVPGLLQTPAYAREIIGSVPGLFDEHEIQHRVDVRMQRQVLLARPRAPHLRVVLSEAVLHRLVGDRGLMTDQLRHLVDAGQRGNISVRIVPWSAGAHGGMAAASGGFSLLEFPADSITGQPLEPPLAYVDSLTGAMYLTKPDEVGAYQLAWEDVERAALDGAASRAAIITAMEGLSP
jgi:transcriptional regulator with XRE-family HTH domain